VITRYAIPPRGTEDELSDFRWVEDKAGLHHVVYPNLYGAGPGVDTGCHKGALKLPYVELWDDLNLCERCAKRLNREFYELDYCWHCGAFVLAWRDVIGVHQVQRVGPAGVYVTQDICPATWQRLSEPYLPLYPMEGQSYDPAPAPVAERPGDEGPDPRDARVDGAQDVPTLLWRPTYRTPCGLAS
jgi:hypothetical protein